MTEAIVPEELAARVRELIDQHDHGDVAQAAHRIGTRECDLRAILRGDSSHPSLGALSAIVRGYDVDTWWLISGELEAGSSLPPERRVDTLNLLSELGTTLTMQRRLGHQQGVSLDDSAGASA
jgi:transcriptional regulator with XRE-family HTH domain